MLTSTEDFAAIKNAIPYFEQSTTVGRSGCEAVDVTAYASPGMQYAQMAFANWQQEEQKGSALVPDPDVGPPPDVWIPDSTSEIPAAEPAFDKIWKGLVEHSLDGPSQTSTETE